MVGAFANNKTCPAFTGQSLALVGKLKTTLGDYMPLHGNLLFRYELPANSLPRLRPTHS